MNQESTSNTNTCTNPGCIYRTEESPKSIPHKTSLELTELAEEGKLPDYIDYLESIRDDYEILKIKIISLEAFTRSCY